MFLLPLLLLPVCWCQPSPLSSVTSVTFTVSSQGVGDPCKGALNSKALARLQVHGKTLECKELKVTQPELVWSTTLPDDSLLVLNKPEPATFSVFCVPGLTFCGGDLGPADEEVTSSFLLGTKVEANYKTGQLTFDVSASGNRVEEPLEIADGLEFRVLETGTKEFTVSSVHLKPGGRLYFAPTFEAGALYPTQLRTSAFEYEVGGVVVIELPQEFNPVHAQMLTLSLVSTSSLGGQVDKITFVYKSKPLGNIQATFKTAVESVELDDGSRANVLQAIVLFKDSTMPLPTRSPPPVTGTTRGGDAPGPNSILIPAAAGGAGGLLVLILCVVLVVCLVKRARRQAREQPSMNGGGHMETMMSARQDEPGSTTPEKEVSAFDDQNHTRQSQMNSQYDVAPPSTTMSMFPSANSSSHPSARTSYASPKVTDFQNSVYAVVPEALRSETDPWEIDFNELQMGKVLGEGAYGTVSEAMFRGKKVAVKQLHQNLLKPKDIKDFKKEAKLMKSLTPHANVVQLIGVNTDEHNPPLFIVTEYCGGGACDSYLKKYGHLLNQSQRVAMMVAACRGVMHLHEQSIIHRDLACRNFLLTTEGGLKVADFGMSRDTNEDGNQTKCDVGPLRYMAPESMAKKTYSVETDCWAFGVVMWEIESNAATPYGDMALTMVAIGVAKEGLRLPQPKGCPDDLYALMMQCWSHNPSDRPSFAEIDERLLSLQT